MGAAIPGTAFGLSLTRIFVLEERLARNIGAPPVAEIHLKLTRKEASKGLGVLARKFDGSLCDCTLGAGETRIPVLSAINIRIPDIRCQILGVD